MNDIDEQLNTHRGMVTRLAHRYKSKTPSHIPVEDFIQEGMMALWKILKEGRFSDTGTAKFTTFVSYRIKGSFIDLSRSEDWVPRAERQSGEVVNTIYNYEDFISEKKNYITTIPSESLTTRDPLEEILHKEKYKVLLEEIENLPERDREILFMAHDTKHEEIVKKFELSSKVRVCQIMKQNEIKLTSRMKEVYA